MYLSIFQVKKIAASGDLQGANEMKDKKAWKGALARADGHKVSCCCKTLLLCIVRSWAYYGEI